MEFTVYGKPQTAGSKRGFTYRKHDGRTGVAITDDNPKGYDWKQQVIAAAILAKQDAGMEGVLTCPLSVSFRFFTLRPKSHYGTGKNAGKVKASSPLYPAKKPDVLKLARCVEDALTGVLWRDDAQIVVEFLCKEFGETEKVVISVTEMT